MKVKGNPLYTGASGKIGNLVVRQFDGEPIISKVPDMSRRKLSEKQKEANENMMMAIKSAKHICQDPRTKEKACLALGVPPNKVFRAVVKYQLLHDMDAAFLHKTDQEKQETEILKNIKSIIITALPDAQLKLYGNRAQAIDAPSDWDILILTTAEQPKTLQLELQEKLFPVMVQSGFRVNTLILTQNEWDNSPNYQLLKKKIGDSLVDV